MTYVAAKQDLAPQLTLCSSLVEAAAISLREQARSKGLAIRVVAADDDLTLAVDRRAFGHIVLHLMRNALRFTEHGGVRVGIRRRHHNGRRTVEISIADTGVGISHADRSPLERPGTSLHASQALARAIGGHIDMASEPGFGTTFTLSLPDR